MALLSVTVDELFMRIVQTTYCDALGLKKIIPRLMKQLKFIRNHEAFEG
jgi:hypothetical protein